MRKQMEESAAAEGGRRRKGELPIDEVDAPMPQLAHAAHRLHPVLPLSSVGKESLSPNYPDTYRRF